MPTDGSMQRSADNTAEADTSAINQASCCQSLVSQQQELQNKNSTPAENSLTGIQLVACVCLVRAADGGG
jgi:hypothetical protein